MKYLVAGLCVFSMTAFAQFPDTYVGGNMDLTTPAVRILAKKNWVYSPKKQKTIPVTVQLSSEFLFCGDCVAPLPDGYGQLPQIPNQGHVHVYFKRKGGFTENRSSDVFCPFNQFNESTEEIAPNIWRSDCPAPARGLYKVCAIVETDSHTQRVKAEPRDFPPADCIELRIVGKR